MPVQFARREFLAGMFAITAASAASRVITPSDTKSPFRIAVINDDTAFLDLMRDLLETEGGYEAVICREWEDAHAFVKDQRPALVDPRGGPITGGRVVPCSWRATHGGSPGPVDADGGWWRST